MYAYLPFNSNHSVTTKRGIISTETFRMLITNRFHADFATQIAFFAQKLCDRGYPLELILKGFFKLPWSSKDSLIRRAKVDKPSIVPFKLKWNRAYEGFSLGSTDLESCLDSEIRKRIQVVLCYTSDPNLFRLRYGRFL